MGTTFNKKWFQWDLARGRTFKRDEAVFLLDFLARCGYNGIGLYLEGCFEFPRFNGILREGCMTPDDAKWFCEEAKKRDIEVIPFTNLVGHATNFSSQEQYSRYTLSPTQFDLEVEGYIDFAKSIIDQYIECFNPSMLHIGGDEIFLNDEIKVQYPLFLSKMCEYINSKGVEAGIWADMIIAHPEMTEGLSRDLVVFDWWYGSHRFETSKILKDKGFNKLFSAPGTMSWDTIISTQYLCPWRDELPWRTDVDVDKEEIEAFIADSAENGVDNVYLTDWENYHGGILYNAAYAIARAGQYMNGKPYDDDSLSNVIFGKKTPYMDCVHILTEAQLRFLKVAEKFPGRTVTHGRFANIVFNPSYFGKVLRCGEYIPSELLEFLDYSVAEAGKILNSWETEDFNEEFFKKNLVFAVNYTEMAKCVLAIAKDIYKKYHNAALTQFTSPDESAKYLNEIIDDLKSYSAMYPAFIAAEAAAIEFTGQRREDLSDLKNMQDRIDGFALELAKYLPDGELGKKKLSIPSFVKMIATNFPIIALTD